MNFDTFDDKFELEVFKSWVNIHEMHSTSYIFHLYNKIALILIKYLSLTRELDLENCIKQVDKQKRLKYYFTNKSNPSSWVKLLRYIYIITTITTIYQCIIQLRYDWTNINLKRLLVDTNKVNNSNYNDSYQSESHNLKEQLIYYETILDYIGAPFLHYPFFIEGHIMFILVCAFSTYPECYIYNRYVKPLDLSPFGILVARKLYLRYYVKIVIEEVNKFIESSQRYADIYLHQETNCSNEYNIIDELSELTQELTDGSEDENNNLSDNIMTDLYENNITTDLISEKMYTSYYYSNNNNNIKLLKDHKRCCNQLKRMILSGDLMPFHRRPDYIDYISYYIIIFCNLLNISAAIFVPGQLYFLQTYDLSTQPNRLSDLIVYFNLLALVIFSDAGSIYFLSAVSLNCLDYIYSAIKLKKKIELCIKSNELIFYQIYKMNLIKTNNNITLNIFNGDLKNIDKSKQSLFDYDIFNHLNSNIDGQYKTKAIIEDNNDNYISKINNIHRKDQMEILIEELNANLLYVLIHYKIFIRLFTITKDTLGILGYIAIQNISVALCIFILLVGEVDLKLLPEVVASFLFMGFWLESCILPICYLNSRIIDLFNGLFSIIAHTTRDDFDDSTELINGRNKQKATFLDYYDQHLIESLRKESNFMNRIATKQLSVTILGLAFSFSTYVRLHVMSVIVVTVTIYSSYNYDSHTDGRNILMRIY